MLALTLALGWLGVLLLLAAPLLARGQSANLKPACRSKNTTAPCSNSVPTTPSVERPSPSQ